MKENKTKKPYEKPSMEVIEVDPTSILAGSGEGEWGEGERRDILWDK